MEQLQVFKNSDFGELKVIVIDGKEMFDLDNVAWSLGYTRANANGVIYLRHDRIEKVIENLDITVCVHDGHKYIDESGLYDFVFEAGTARAREFRKWVTSEVLPSIRKTGSYSVQKPQTIEDLIIMQAQSVKELKAQVSTLGEAVETIQNTFLQCDENWRDSINKMLNKAAFKLGGNYRELRNRSYELLEERARCDLDKRLRNLLDRLVQQGATKTQINRTSKMDVIEADTRLKEIYSTIVKELSIGSIKAV